MKRILISQRRDIVSGRDETRDGLDVVWAKLLFLLGFIPVPVCSELAGETEYIAGLGPSGILLTGGNDIGEMEKRDQIESNLLDYAKENDLPVIGVCRGMQMLNVYCGGTLIDVENHVATRHTITGNILGNEIHQTVNSYHNQGITESTIAKTLVALAKADDGIIECLVHKLQPWIGIMWHPEREGSLTKIDAMVFKNFFK